jgi:hypothetical protein
MREIIYYFFSGQYLEYYMKSHCAGKGNLPRIFGLKSLLTHLMSLLDRPRVVTGICCNYFSSYKDEKWLILANCFDLIEIQKLIRHKINIYMNQNINYKIYYEY